MITVANVRTYRGSMNGACYVGRPTIYGNPFRTTGRDALPRNLAIDAFKEYWFASAQAELRARALRELIPPIEVLLCWCPPRACHAQVIADFVNQHAATI